MKMQRVCVFWQGEHYDVILINGAIDAIIDRDGTNIEPSLSDVAFCEVQDEVNLKLWSEQ